MKKVFQVIIDDFEILWRGRVPLSSVQWHFNPSKYFQFPSSFEKRRQKIWDSMVKQFPQIYDGELLVLDKFSLEKGIPKLHTRSIRFSQLLVYAKENRFLPESLGSLAFQAVVMDPTNSYVLIGERTHSSMYKPGYLSLPGGMFETMDAQTSLTDACLRELSEEISLATGESSFNLIAIFRASNVGTCLLVELETIEGIPDGAKGHLKIVGSEEWEGKELEWISFAQLGNLDSGRLTDGVNFLRETQLKKK